MKKLNQLYEGKAKKIYATDEENKVIIYYKDDATAFNGAKKASIDEKGVLNNEITSILFKLLEDNGVETHFIEKLSHREQVCKKVNRSEEHTSELQSRQYLVCRLLLE